MDDGEEIAANSADIRGHNRKNGVGGDGGIDGAAAAAQDCDAGSGGEVVW
jgi:hypothetical protein